MLKLAGATKLENSDYRCGQHGTGTSPESFNALVLKNEGNRQGMDKMEMEREALAVTEGERKHCEDEVESAL